MADWQLETPVLLIIFNRPDTTEKVFRAIAQAQPRKLFVAADGPRADQPGDAEKCTAARAVAEQVDWECEVLRNYSDVNLGCALRPPTAVSWVFEHVDETIILEDDCVPHPTFFRFCDELLEKYRNDGRTMAISGDNFQIGRRRTKDSYYFSRYNHCWGWATWRRAWQYYDHDMTLWPEIRDAGWLEDILSEPSAVRYWAGIFQAVYEGRINSWAYRWTFACWIQSGLSILPNVNLVANIGFTAEATHTKGSSRFANMPVETPSFPLRHPQFVIRDTRADDFTQENVFDAIRRKRNNLLARVRRRLSVIRRKVQPWL